MERTIEIDGKQVRLRSNAATPIRYKTQFGRDFFSDILKMNALTKFDEKKENYEVLEKLDMTVFYNLIWVYAKTADSSIPDPIQWLDGFEEFPLEEVMETIQELLLHSFKSKKK